MNEQQSASENKVISWVTYITAKNVFIYKNYLYLIFISDFEQFICDLIRNFVQANFIPQI